MGWMGQSAKQSRHDFQDVHGLDDFQDVHGLDDLILKNFPSIHFSKCVTFSTRNIT